MKKTLMVFTAASLLNAVSAQKREDFVPVLHIRVEKPIQALDTLEKLAEPFVKPDLEAVKKKGELMMVKSMLQPEKPIDVTVSLHRSLHGEVLRSNLRDFSAFIRFSIRIPLRNPEEAKKNMAAGAKKDGDDYLLDPDVRARFGSDHVLIFNGRTAPDTAALVEQIASRVPDQIPTGSLAYFKCDFQTFESIWGEDINKYIYLLIEKEEKTGTEKKTPGMKNDGFAAGNPMMLYFYELYIKFYLQSYRMSASPRWGALFAEPAAGGNRHMKLRGLIHSTTEDRPFLRLFNERRKISLKRLRDSGQTPVKVPEGSLHISIPLNFGDFLTTLNEYRESDIHLVAGTIRGMITIADFIALEDTTGIFWRQLNSNMDIYILPDKTPALNPFIAILEMDDTAKLKDLINRSYARSQYYLRKEKTLFAEKHGDDLFVISRRTAKRERNAYLKICDRAVVITTEEAMTGSICTGRMPGSFRVDGERKMLQQPLRVRGDLRSWQIDEPFARVIRAFDFQVTTSDNMEDNEFLLDLELN